MCTRTAAWWIGDARSPREDPGRLHRFDHGAGGTPTLTIERVDIGASRSARA